MTDEAIVGLIVASAGSLSTIGYYLISSIRKNLDSFMTQMLNKLDKFVNEIGEVRESLAVKGTKIDYMQCEIETIKKRCWKCSNLQKEI
jgi:hypothetical protein